MPTEKLISDLVIISEEKEEEKEELKVNILEKATFAHLKKHRCEIIFIWCWDKFQYVWSVSMLFGPGILFTQLEYIS